MKSQGVAEAREDEATHSGPLPRARADAQEAAPSATTTGTVSAQDFLETLNVLVGLVETGRASLRGHSAAVARHVHAMAERMDLEPAQTQAIMAAALLHDLGKGGPYHLTPLNVSEWEAHRHHAETRYLTPVKLFETVQLWPETVGAVAHMYEKPDGSGLPDGLVGRQIPLGARLLAVADAYADLTSNPRNPFRRELGSEEAVEVLRSHARTIFDPDAVALLSAVAVGVDLRQRLLSGSITVLVIEPDADQRSMLELRLASEGYAVVASRTADQALRALYENEVDAVVSEVDLQPMNGFEVLRRMKADERLSSVPLLFLTGRTSQEDAQRGLELGAADYLTKPTSTGVMIAKIRKAVAQSGAGRGGGGVQGSLGDMSLPDLLQVLSQGRRTGRLRLMFQPAGQGELHILDGLVVNAKLGASRGEDAVFGMLKLTAGHFEFDPSFTPDRVVIKSSTEALLLEGMRKIDEEGR